jgi:hypothetical protein
LCLHGRVNEYIGFFHGRLNEYIVFAWESKRVYRICMGG